MSEIYTPDPIDVPEVPGAPVGTNGDPSKDWMAIVALVTGILALCTSFIPIVCCVAPLLAVAAIVFGILGLKSTKRTLALVGLILGGVGILAQVIITVIGFATGSYMENYDTILEQIETYQ